MLAIGVGRVAPLIRLSEWLVRRSQQREGMMASRVVMVRGEDRITGCGEPLGEKGRLRVTAMKAVREDDNRPRSRHRLRRRPCDHVHSRDSKTTLRNGAFRS